MIFIHSSKVIFLTTIVALGMSTIARPSLAQSDSSQSSTVGLEFEGSRSLNVGNLIETEYIGDCPGREVSSQTARFTSEDFPPGDGQRVVIKNMTRGLGETPYTDREYDKGRVSEGMAVKFGTSHNSKFFIVLPGENSFQYEVRRQDSPIATGTFTAIINQESRQVERNAQWVTDEVCGNTSVSQNVCADLRSRQQFKCPNGNVLQTRWDKDYDRGVRTSFRNRTGNAIHFNLDGDQYVVQPNEQINIRRRDRFRVNFNPTCPTCSPSKNQYVTHGTRMQFRMNSGQIELRDDR